MLIERSRLNVKNRSPSPAQMDVLISAAQLAVAALVFGIAYRRIGQMIPIRGTGGDAVAFFSAAGLGLLAVGLIEEVVS